MWGPIKKFSRECLGECLELVEKKKYKIKKFSFDFIDIEDQEMMEKLLETMGKFESVEEIEISTKFLGTKKSKE